MAIGRRCSREATARFTWASLITAAVATWFTTTAKTDTVHDIGDLNVLTGQQNLRVGPQSKIHTKFAEGKDGRIYFATQYGNDFDFARVGTPEWYPGGHWMVYDPKTGQTTDLGLAFPGVGIIAGSYDPHLQPLLWRDRSAR